MFYVRYLPFFWFNLFIFRELAIYSSFRWWGRPYGSFQPVRLYYGMAWFRDVLIFKPVNQMSGDYLWNLMELRVPELLKQCFSGKYCHAERDGIGEEGIGDMLWRRLNWRSQKAVLAISNERKYKKEKIDHYDPNGANRFSHVRQIRCAALVEWKFLRDSRKAERHEWVR